MSVILTNPKNKSDVILGNVNWIITDNCNYDCGYCFKAKKRHEINQKITVEKLKIIERDTDKILKNIKKMFPGVWHFDIGGGEPFMHPFFFKIIKALVKMNHRISIVSNFSAADETILNFLSLAGDKLIRFTASLHLDHTTADEFIAKLKRITRLSLSKKNFSSNVVIQRNKIKEIEAASHDFIDNNLLLLIVPRRDDKGNYADHSQEEMKIIRNNLEMIRESFRGKISEPNFKLIEDISNYGLDPAAIRFMGKKCKAGSTYGVILSNADIYRCFPSIGDKKGYLGNILNGTFKLKSKATRCPYESCFCIGPTGLKLMTGIDKKF